MINKRVLGLLILVSLGGGILGLEAVGGVQNVEMQLTSHRRMSLYAKPSGCIVEVFDDRLEDGRLPARSTGGSGLEALVRCAQTVYYEVEDDLRTPEIN